MDTKEMLQLSRIWHQMLEQSQAIMSDLRYQHLNRLSTTEISILSLLHQQPDMILKDICEGLRMPKSTLTSAVNALVRKGYVQRLPSPKDRRAYCLHITQTGEEAQQEHMDFEHTVLEQLVGGLDSEEMQTLVRLLHTAMGGSQNEQK